MTSEKKSRPPLQISGKTALRLFGYISGRHRFLLICVFVFIIVSSAANVASASFIQRLIDDYITPMLQTAAPDYAGLLTAIGVMALLYTAGVVSTLFYNRFMVTISQGVLKRIRDDTFSHMQDLPAKYFDTNAFGDIMSRYTNDTDTLRQLISMSIPQTFASLVMIIAVTVAMLTISPPMTILVFVCVAVMLAVTRVIGGRSAVHFIKQQQMLGVVNAFIEEMLNGQKVIKVFCHEAASGAEFDERNDILCASASEANRYANIIMPIMGNIGNVQYVLIALIGGAMAIFGAGGVTLGAIAAFLTLARSFSQPIGQISTQVNAVVMALAGAERIFSLLDEPAEADAGYVTLVNAKYEDGEIAECSEHTGVWAWKHPHRDGTLSYTAALGDVRLTDVDFAYEEAKPVLRNISIYAEPGQKIALVGATGAGKTTITNLLTRFYDIADGKIRFDGININKIKKSDLRRSLGMVLQDTNLFTGSVMDNIRYGNLSATDGDVVRAAKLANAHDFIMRLPEGYNTVIEGDGGSLSQGQRQLLSIARAAAADPPVMILDEATSSIDTRTEAIVQKGMDSLMEGRTVFVIAHRLSTIQNAHAIMVMDHGEIIERGSHETLLARKGKYYQLYTGAFGHE